MEQKALIQALGFTAKEATNGIFYKHYAKAGNYAIEVDFDNRIINFGSRIKGESKTTQNFSQAENWVVLECVDRLLEKGYKPEDITLEKVFPSGHGHSGRLDVFVQKDGKAFLMIECKTYGKEYDKELKAIHKNGGQLFTYFQNDTKTQYLMLYASQLNGKSIDAKWDIVKIEDHYRNAGNVADFYDRWSKITYQNGIFEDWVVAYDFKNKLLTKKELLPLKETDSEAIFHGFMSILRKHSVSDEPNAFNKIFNLFLAKIYDEKKRDNDELEFQWREKQDDPVEFQVRLINLYQKGMYEFLRKEVEGISDKDFAAKTPEELHEKKKKWLMFNNVFAIKEVIDSESFDDNHRVLKEVVELLHKYQIRYPRRQAHLSDFFERLLTTGLKQKAGQYFSPPPVTRFIVKSLPVREIIREELKGETAKLPAVIDYAVGSGHFITEIMEEYQNIIDHDIDTTHLYPDVITDVEGWQRKKYDWAARYIYGIEKDYRLVKVAKVGCYFYGDGLAQIIHGDGLDSFRDSKSFVGRLKKVDDSELEKFSIVVSNPPYSVEAFKGDLKNKNAAKDFELYPLLTDKSSEIECLFVERTKQLLKDGGLAAIILPSSILSNAGNLHTRTREIILQHFELVAITEFGGNTFMATNISTVTLFLRRKYRPLDDIRDLCADSIRDAKDVTINGLEKSLSRYVSHTWENVSLSDYQGFLRSQPNEVIQAHGIYREYRKKVKAKSEDGFWASVLRLEQEKLYYFVLVALQKVVIVRSGEKKELRQFLGYEFSDRKGKEGIYPINRRSTIDDSTKMYNLQNSDDPTKASTYIRRAFGGVYDCEISEPLEGNIRYAHLKNLMSFSRFDFNMSISLNAKEKIQIDSKWPEVRFDEIAEIIRGVTYSKADQAHERTNVIILTSDNITLDGELKVNKEVFLYDDFTPQQEKQLKKNDIFMCFSSGSKEHLGKVAFIEENTEYFAGGFMGIIRTLPSFEAKYIFYLLNSLLRQPIRNLGSGSNINNLSGLINEIKVPSLPLDVQRKIVAEIEIWEEREIKAKQRVQELKEEIENIVNDTKGENKKIQTLCKYSVERVNNASLTSKNYIGVDNLLQNTSGKTNSNFVPNSGTSTAYRAKDILLSNIRPYLKKIWYADNDGGSSNDVLVLQTTIEDVDSKYLFYHLKQDKFFDYEMQEKKGVKMPRGDKQHIMDYVIPLPSLVEQLKIVAEIEQAEEQIAALEQELSAIAVKKQQVLKEYLL